MYEKRTGGLRGGFIKVWCFYVGVGWVGLPDLGRSVSERETSTKLNTSLGQGRNFPKSLGVSTFFGGTLLLCLCFFHLFILCHMHTRNLFRHKRSIDHHGPRGTSTRASCREVE